MPKSTGTKSKTPRKTAKKSTVEVAEGSSAVDAQFFEEQGLNRYDELSDIEHARMKSSDTGSAETTPSEGFWVDFIKKGDDLAWKVVQETRSVCEKLGTAIREPFVNISDIAMSGCGMRNVWIELDGEGVISVRNDGKGIPVERHPKIIARDPSEEAKGLGEWVPRICFERFRAGGNVKRAHGTKLGGTNGKGVKLTNALSHWLKIFTCDGKNVFEMRWDGMENPGRPIVRKKKRGEKPGTCVRFKLNREWFSRMSEKVLQIQTRWFVHTLTAILAVYLRPLRVQVHLNDELIECTNLSTLMKLEDLNAAVSSEAADEPDRRPICIDTKVSFPTSEGKETLSDERWEICIIPEGGGQNFSIVNGTATYNGPHFEEVYKVIKDAVNARLAKDKFLKDSGAKQVDKKYVKARVTLIMVTRMPDADWNDQCKTNLCSPSEFEIKIAKTSLGPICDVILSEITGSLHKKRDTQENKQKVDARMSKKYSRARSSGGREWTKCVLVITEGDSADSTAKRIFLKPTLKRKPYWMCAEYCGFYNLGGNPMNAMKHISIDSKGHVVMTAKMRANAPLRNLKTLFEEKKYGHIIFATDADIDGDLIKCSLISFFRLLSTAAFLRGDDSSTVPRVYAWSTPCARIEKGPNAPRSFFTPLSMEGVTIPMRYYKGLGALPIPKDQMLIDDINERLIPIECVNEESLRAFGSACELWYLGSASGRRDEMSTTGDPKDEEHLEEVMEEREPKGSPIKKPTERKILSITHAPAMDAGAFVRHRKRVGACEVACRHITHAVDGLYEAQRKVVFAFPHIPDEDQPIAQRVGDVISHGGYAHGSALEGVITNMGRDMAGGGAMPLIRLIGQGPNRVKGGDAAAAARYLHMKPNRRLANVVFPQGGLPFLPRVLAYGKECEPHFYVPSVPHSVMMFNEGICDGWSQKVFARSPRSCASAVLEMIGNDTSNPGPGNDWPSPECPVLDPCLWGFTGKWHRTQELIRPSEREARQAYVDNLEGEWYYDETRKELVITDVPIFSHEFITVENYVTKRIEPAVKKVLPEAVVDSLECVENIVCIRIPMSPAEYAKLEEADGGVAKQIALQTTHKPAYLNFANDQGSIQHFRSYEEVVEYWYVRARELYGRRRLREIALLEVRLELLRSEIRFCRDYERMGIQSGMKVSKMEALLRKAKFVPINASFVKSPGRVVEPEDIRAQAFDEDKGASYNYLLRLSSLDRTDSKVTAREVKKAEMVAELERQTNDVRPFDGAGTWVREVTEFMKILNEGEKTNWKFEDAEKDVKVKAKSAKKKAPGKTTGKTTGKAKSSRGKASGKSRK